MIAARYASLVAFAQSRGSDCGRDADGKFSSGNKCAVEVQELPKIAGIPGPVIAGAALGASFGSVAGVPGMAVGGTLGAIFGVVHSLLSKSMPEMVSDAQRTVGLTGRQVDKVARAIGSTSKDKAQGFLTTHDAFGLWSPNDDIAVITNRNPWDKGATPSRSLHFEPTPETMRSGKVASIALNAAKAAGAVFVTASSRGPVSQKSLEDAGFKRIDSGSQLMNLSGTALYQKRVSQGKSSRAFCPNGKGNGVTNTCGKGIGVNDAEQDFTGQILAGEKTIETRPTNSLKPYIGKTVGIVRTGKGKATLVGVMKVGEPKFYKTRKDFDADFDKHRVGKDSGHYIGPEGKFGYPLSEVKPVKPRILKSTGYVARVIAKKVRTRDLLVEFDLDAESPEEPNTESRGDAPSPAKDQVKGSDVNDEGSAKNKSGDISLDEGTISSLKKKVEEHNAAMREAGKPEWTHVRLPSLKAVYRRGAGAFSTSHRPGMTRDQWAMARVNAFLTLARRGRPENSKYTTDNDLLHSSHPKHSGESRSTDCGREDDGKFGSGNKCAGSVDMPKEDPKGRMRYDNGVQTDAARKLYQMGSSEKKLKGLVDVMGGDAKNTRVDINPPSLNISVADKDGNKLFHVDVENGRARLYPTKDLSPAESKKIREAASEAFGGTEADTAIKVYRKAEDIKKWQRENDAKIKAWEDKYAFSLILPPHQRPKKWERSIDAKHASLLAFVQSRGFCPNGEGGGVTNTCSSQESSPQEPEAEEPPPSLHLLASSDADAPQSKEKSGDGEVTVVWRTNISTPDYLDEIECHGRDCGLEVTFEMAKQLQPDSDIKDDWSPLDAYVGPGAGYFTGYDGSLGENADGSIDYHGADYGTIDDYSASELLAEKQKEVEKEWNEMSDDEKNVASMKLLYGVDGSPPEDEDVVALRESGKKQWMDENTSDIEDSINAMRVEARENAVKQMAKELESAVAEDTIECCLQLYRGLRVDPAEVDRMISSGYVVHENVNSWTTSRDVSRSFGATRLLLVTRKPRVGHIFSSNAHSEMEVVRPPSRMRILGVVRTSTGTVLHVDEDEDYKGA